MNFAACISEGMVKKVPVNKIRAGSMLKSANQAITTAKIIPLNDDTKKTIIRELYEGLREHCEAIGYIKGYKFNNHESIGYFIKDELSEQRIRNKFDRYRKFRNGINYYGDDIDMETVKEALKEIPLIMKELEKHMKEFK